MSKRTKTKRPSKKSKKSVESQSEDDYEADSSELDEEFADPSDKSPVEYIPRKRVRPAPVVPKNQAPDPELELQKKVKADYGTNCEKLEARILKDASILGDIEKLRLLEKIFGIKKLYKTEHNIAEIKMNGKLFVCAECGQSYTTRPGIKYHISGRCPEVPSIHKCRLCEYQSGETFKIDSHIRLEHLKQQSEITPRKPAQTMSWLISEQLLRSSYQYKKHAEPKAAPISDPLSESDEISHRKGWKFSNNVSVKTGKKLMSKTVEPRTAWETSDIKDHGYKFECNSGFHSIRCFNWLRAGNIDAFAISTPPFKIKTTDLHKSSFLQFWHFPSSLISNDVQPPQHHLTKQCPFAINSLAQVVDDIDNGYLAMACDDGFIRLIAFGVNKSSSTPCRFAVDSSNKELVLNGTQQSNPLSMDSFNDLIVAGYASGLVAVYKISAAKQTISPLRVFDTHGLPISSICFHSFDHDIFTTSSFERITTIWSCTRGQLYSTGDSPSHMILDSCWMQDMLALATDNVFQDHFGVVIYDPNFMDTRLKQRIGYSQPISSIDYAHLHGTLAIADIDGRISLTSLPNPRKQMNMTRKGFQTIVVSLASISPQEKDGKKFDMLFEDHKDLSKMNEQHGLPSKKADVKKGYVAIDHSTVVNYSCVRWNTSGSRACWLGFTSGSGIVRIQYMRGLTRESQTSSPLSPSEFEKKCTSYR
ncbi:unnamed protein product [Oikopleura dioica]|uniref:C2H2-type domain-containing protein n=1 Tax=Oikopleura dioica TaxID=34765 RepID=E4WZY2_OIKDI|nr:unnamed protein product [Oikopleura dioica]